MADQGAEYRLLIGGERVDGARGSYAITNPATEEVVGQAPEASVEQAREVAILGEREMRLARAFWPGPLTLVMPARPVLTAALLAGGSTVAIRVPSHVVARELCRVFGVPLTATSANRSGEQPAASAHDVITSFVSEIDLVLDAGATPGGPPSTIVEAGGGVPRLLRAGAVPWDRVVQFLSS